MKKKFNNQLILTICVTLIILSCNEKVKKAEEANADSTSSAKTEAVQPAAQNATPDAITAAPNLYKVLSDSMGIRIVEVNYKPGDSSALHTHPDYAIYVIDGGKATFYGKDGTKMENEMKTGLSLVKAGEVHSVKNTGKSIVKAIIVEVNRGKGTGTMNAATDAAKVASSLYKVKNDTLGFRVLEINYKPGEMSKTHSHPDAVLYVIEPGTAEFTGKDGKKRVLELKKGMTMITPADTHSVKNIGKTTMKAILVEVNRSM